MGAEIYVWSEDNIKMDVKETVCESVDWIQLVLVITVMNFQVP
jgi:hypothetical protein